MKLASACRQGRHPVAATLAPGFTRRTVRPLRSNRRETPSSGAVARCPDASFSVFLLSLVAFQASCNEILCAPVFASRVRRDAIWSKRVWILMQRRPSHHIMTLCLFFVYKSTDCALNAEAFSPLQFRSGQPVTLGKRVPPSLMAGECSSGLQPAHSASASLCAV